MADSRRELAMQTLEALLVAMPQFSAEQVTRTATAGPTEGTYPRVDIREGADASMETAPDAPHHKTEHNLTVVLQVWVSGPDEIQRRLNNLKGEIEKVLQTNPNYKLGGNAKNLHILGSDSQVSRDQQYNSCYITLQVKYRHALDDPFAP